MNQIVFSFTVFLAGILSFFSPCVFPLLPVYIGVLLGSDQEKSVQIFGKKIRWHGIVKTLCFIAGISVIFLIIGFGAGLLGQVMYTNWFRYVMGALIIILGLHQMEVFHFHFLEKQKSVDFGANKQKNELFSAFLLGLGFSFGWTPCIGPVLGSVLALAASNGQDALVGSLSLYLYIRDGHPILALSTGIRPCIALFQSSQTPSLVAEENRWSHHHYYGDSITLGTIK